MPLSKKTIRRAPIFRLGLFCPLVHCLIHFSRVTEEVIVVDHQVTEEVDIATPQVRGECFFFCKTLALLKVHTILYNAGILRTVYIYSKHIPWTNIKNKMYSFCLKFVWMYVYGISWFRHITRPILKAPQAPSFQISVEISRLLVGGGEEVTD